MITATRDPGYGNANRPIARIPITLTINGTRRELEVEPWTSLLDLLRDRLDLTGTKKGCDHGQCGACTVLIDGKRINSCLKLAVSVDASEITTIEGLGQPGDLHPLQAASPRRWTRPCRTERARTSLISPAAPTLST